MNTQRHKNLLFVTFLICFIVTFAITLLGITDVLKIRDGYLNVLFGSLVLELVAAVIALFKKTSFTDDGSKDAQIDGIEKRVRGLVGQMDDAKKKCPGTPAAATMESTQCALESISTDLKRLLGL